MTQGFTETISSVGCLAPSGARAQPVKSVAHNQI
eukprot:CAMPEP_0204051244 /NCGR_PEP_ID=MMETSP0360-20130528/122040_1 /ASSEMBLY_ACC=CAM_ASM_000342 /TAXON_ID=268821 /ORGANISM="Scrippsiella Hangoei, Strain SHTV-5" /LENGTH=33 /DNA_ID= /DNA_START= /DNA_END= /DNA_ORIENTATION=